MQLRQRPQTTWPSPLTRSPGWNPVTFEPTSTTSPTNSCPITSGTGIVRCAQASQRWMWTSVPQMPVLETRINTSLIPISGSGTSSSQRPGSARLLTSAFTARAGDSRCPGGESYAGASRPGRNGASRRREVLLRRPRTVEQPDQHRRERGCEERRQDRARRPDEDVDQGDDPAGHGERAEHHARNATPTEERVRRDGEERGEDERTDSPGLGHVVPADEPDDPHEAEERRLREAEERRKHDDERQLLTRSLHVLLLASGGGVGSSHDSSRGTRLHEHTPRPGGPGFHPGDGPVKRGCALLRGSSMSTWGERQHIQVTQARRARRPNLRRACARGHERWRRGFEWAVQASKPPAKRQISLSRGGTGVGTLTPSCPSRPSVHGNEPTVVDFRGHRRS